MLKCLTVPVTPFQQNCSIVWCDETMKAAVIDPGGDLDVLLAAVAHLGVTLEQIWLTHAHIDHAGGTAELAGKLNLPIIGKAVNRIAVSRFTRILGTLIKSGVPILEALEVLRGVVGNRVISDAIGEARDSIREGQSVAAPIAATGVFEPMVTQMIAVGEETGSLDDMLERMAVFYDNEVTFAIEAMLKSMEPAMIVFVAGIIGSIMVATYLPGCKIITTIQ